MIDIVSEARNEGVSVGQRWNLHQRDSTPHDQVPQECDMQLSVGVPAFADGCPRVSRH